MVFKSSALMGFKAKYSLKEFPRESLRRNKDLRK